MPRALTIAVGSKERNDVTTCSRCGLMCRAGTPVCPRCGMNLTPAYTIPPDVSPRWPEANRPYASPQYPEYPAPPYPAEASGYGIPQPGAGTPQRVSMNSLVNEDALPEWLRYAAGSGALPPAAPPDYQAGRPPMSAPPYNQPPSARPAVPPSPVGTGGLGANNLFDESALPDWLRAGAMGQGPDLPTSSYQAPFNQGSYGAGADRAPMGQVPVDQGPAPYSGSAFPSIERAGSFQSSALPQSGMPAPSLIDTNALPQWLSGRPEANAAPPTYGRDAGRGIPAGSLVDETALPQWLRSEQPTPSNQPPAASWHAPVTSNDSMPSWLSQDYSDTRSPHVESPLSGSSAWNRYAGSGTVGQPAMPPPGAVPGTIAGGEFIDEAALPEWLRSQGGAGDAGSPRNGTGATTFSASDLIDPAALPDWVRDSEAGPSATFSSTAGWTSRQSVPQPAALPGQGQGQPYSTLARSAAVAPNTSSIIGTSSLRSSSAASGAQAPNGSAIPKEELPSWLANSRRTPAARRRAPAAPPAAERRPSRTGRQDPTGNMANGGWGDGPYDRAFDNAGSYGNGYGNGYGEYDDSAGHQRSDHQERRGGWRRLFGRK